MTITLGPVKMTEYNKFAAYLVPMKETFTDPATLLRVKDMFKEYTLDDADSYDLGEPWCSIVYLRNGSKYTLKYYYDKLTGVVIEPSQ